MIDWMTLLTFCVVLGITLAFWNARKPGNLPPGPGGYPFIGNIPMLWSNDRVHLTINSYKETYGPLFSLQFGFYPAVVISSFKLLQQALCKQADQFSNRPNHYLFTKIIGSDTGIINSHGLSWKLCRRLAISSMRDFGVGKSSIEERVQVEAHSIMQEIAKEKKAFSFDILFMKASTNVIFSVLFAKRYDFHEKQFVEVVTKLRLFFASASQLNTTLFLPYLLPLTVITLGKSTKALFSFRGFVRDHIQEHRQTFDKKNIRDFVDTYLDAEIQEADNKVITDRNLFSTIIDLLLAGAETTSTTLQWAMYFMIAHPKVQQKCRQEILLNIGERAPCMNDKNRCPYVDATLCEVQRMSSIVPLSVFHCTNGPVEFEGYKLPDKTIVLPDIFSVHMDPELWQHPEQFQPERFLDEDNKCVRPPYFIPFSLGRRICAGENLAKTEVFIFFSSLLQNYEFSAENINMLPHWKDATLGLTLSPPLYQVIAKPIDQ